MEKKYSEKTMEAAVNKKKVVLKQCLRRHNGKLPDL